MTPEQRERRREYERAWRDKNRVRINATKREYMRKRRSNGLGPRYNAEYMKQWRLKNQEKYREYCRNYAKQWRKKNTEKHRAWKSQYKKALRKNNVGFKILEYLRTRISNVLSGRTKAASTEKLLGCSIKDFKIYLESKFEPGMSLDNYGPVWHVDHIMPCALFDLSKPEHQRRCFHFSNLQPLFGPENLKKGPRATTNQYNLL